MPTADRDLLSTDENIFQDDSPLSKDYADDGEVWYQGDIRDGAVAGKAIAVAMGETGRRAGAGPIVRRLSLTGTITSSGVNVTGIGTDFLTSIAPLLPGIWIQPDARTGEWREVLSVGGDLALTLTSEFKTAIAAPAAFSRAIFVAERLDDLNDRTQNITADADDTFVASNIDISSGHQLRYNGNPVAGYLDDGTPYYIKTSVSVTIPDTLNFASSAHGISNAYTNDKIFNVTWRVDESTASEYQSEFGGVGIIKVLWTDTNIQLNRGTTSGQRIYKLTIWHT